MRISAPLLTLVGTVAGTAAAVVAYQAAAATGGPATEPVSATTDSPAPLSTTWLPCDRGWKVDGDVCVRIKEKVVVVNDLPAPAAAPARATGVRSSGHDDDADEVEDHDAFEDSDDHEFEDEGDDDSRDEADDDSRDEPDHEDVGDDD